MEITDLRPEHEDLYLVCLEDWSEEVREAGPHRAVWYEKMRGQGLRVKLALDDAGTPAGMIQYLPSQHALAEGEGLEFILCIWVHGHKQGRGNFQKRGFGAALLEAAEADARERGVMGMAAWGLALPFWMRASWFKKHGYRKADRMGLQVLLWKPFRDGASPPRWIRPRKEPEPAPGKVCVTACRNGWCTGLNIGYERARQVSAKFGDAVEFRTVDTSEPAARLEWGLTDALFIDGRPVRLGPPPSRQRLERLIGRRVRRLAGGLRSRVAGSAEDRGWRWPGWGRR